MIFLFLKKYYNTSIYLWVEAIVKIVWFNISIKASDGWSPMFDRRGVYRVKFLKPKTKILMDDFALKN